MKAESRKPMFVIQTIASVGRVAWRPTTDQSLQIASSALLTDFRVHVYDMSRQFVPKFWFEDHSNVVTGFLWMDSETLWSCGKDKLVIRRSVQDSFHVDRVLNPSTVAWSPIGKLMACMDRRMGIDQDERR
jgi:hypothetical protein